ncbi:helix-turn-helix domain-containing protein [Sulfurospirillum oryzae]|uniref:helix-turn-helix domain-containing protein n=1 Tax=Sulfurospirillum oryzae TaxID=2976535 RepID=UPI0021E77CC8|nr:helix-turn-helix domain-containing protein [Sulfurospirillum oryzae]
MTITYQEIAEMIDQSKQNIAQLKAKQPKKLELYKLGALCKKYDITEDDLVRILDIKNKEKNTISHT